MSVADGKNETFFGRIVTMSLPCIYLEMAKEWWVPQVIYLMTLDSFESGIDVYAKRFVSFLQVLEVTASPEAPPVSIVDLLRWGLRTAAAHSEMCLLEEWNFSAGYINDAE